MALLLDWWHIGLGAHASWLPGDPRGFRNRDHRIHSSGDYRNPPPHGEHAGLHVYNRARSAPQVAFRPIERRLVLSALREAASFRHFRLQAAAVGRVHAHLLIELPHRAALAHQRIGSLKNGASYLLRDVLPGRVWAEGESRRRVRGRDYRRNAFWYIFTGQEAGAATWADVDLWRSIDSDDPRLLEWDQTKARESTL